MAEPDRAPAEGAYALALDTALNACTVALAPFDGAAAGHPIAARSEPARRGHGEMLFAMIEALAKDAGVPLSQVARIVVTTGPGHFSGARIGLAAARAMALGLSCPCIGVSTLEVLLAMAEPAGPAASVIDARRGEVFVLLAGGPPRLMGLEEAAALVAEAFPGAQAVCLIGSGAPLLAEALRTVGSLQDIRIDERTAADAHTLLRFASADPEMRLPRPLYLRAPDAALPPPVPWAARP